MTIEARQMTLRVPTYAPGVNDKDKSTWTVKTRFLDVAPALTHTAKAQFDGARQLATHLADMYNRSPLAQEDDRTMDPDDYFRKKMGENRDHAADGKKAFAISAAYKKNIVLRDLGRKAIADGLVEEEDVMFATMNGEHAELGELEGITTAELAQL
uniref:Uncharacterized protein n=1 Tax=Mycena chlorophos TaxID=658473 RepID=A0ABQ0L6Z0_MYCCL|nr:predicted protein [Mycena chlorophos]